MHIMVTEVGWCGDGGGYEEEMMHCWVCFVHRVSGVVSELHGTDNKQWSPPPHSPHSHHPVGFRLDCSR